MKFGISSPIVGAAFAAGSLLASNTAASAKSGPTNVFHAIEVVSSDYGGNNNISQYSPYSYATTEDSISGGDPTDSLNLPRVKANAWSGSSGPPSVGSSGTIGVEIRVWSEINTYGGGLGGLIPLASGSYMLSGSYSASSGTASNYFAFKFGSSSLDSRASLNGVENVEIEETSASGSEDEYIFAPDSKEDDEENTYSYKYWDSVQISLAYGARSSSYGSYSAFGNNRLQLEFSFGS